MHQVAKELGANYRQLLRAKKKWHDLIEGDLKDFLSLLELRGKVRKDKWTDDKIEFVISMWNENTRASERKKDSIIHPDDRRKLQCQRLHRIHWIEMRLVDMHKLILEEGKKHYDDDFSCSFGVMMRLKPYYVRSGRREYCCCAKCLRYTLFAESLFNWRKKNRAAGLCSCEFRNCKVITPKQINCVVVSC